MKALLALATAVVALAGCNDVTGPRDQAPESTPSLATAAVSSRAADDAELGSLVKRVVALKAQVAAAGRVTLSHQLELDRLAAAVSAWQARTGRGDIKVSSPQALERRSLPTGNTSNGCEACEIIEESPGKICFLKGIGPCVPVGNELWPVCYYLCFDIATGTPDLPRR